ncbi:MAG: hypothetical protein AMJ41_02310 [candidate division Zixibacteria bacterium DG_27]|nr:MAG: hypothetical protein AMJ41_02310 [candidate division Zixibacteria bacterium DG_27]
MREEARTGLSKIEFKIGTSGYSYWDWRGKFYPVDVKGSDMLSYYKDHFDCVEINSTYYRICYPSTFQKMLQRVPRHFEFILKTHRSFTHIRKDIEAPTEKFCQSIEPLLEAEQLRGILAQFPRSFRNSRENFEYLQRAKGHFPGMPLFVEFRHGGWLRQETFRMLEEVGMHYCSVDEPQQEGSLPPELRVVGKLGYIRFHGRDPRAWYDYPYSEDELRGWLDQIKSLKESPEKIYIFFNNGVEARAVENAIAMKELLKRLSEQDDG